jgi:hypothetical protein
VGTSSLGNQRAARRAIGTGGIWDATRSARYWASSSANHQSIRSPSHQHRAPLPPVRLDPSQIDMSLTPGAARQPAPPSRFARALRLLRLHFPHGGTGRQFRQAARAYQSLSRAIREQVDIPGETIPYPDIDPPPGTCRVVGNRLKPPLLPTVGETCAVRSPGRILTRRKQARPSRPRSKGSSASREAQFAFCSVALDVLPASSVLKTLRDVPPARSPRRKTKGEPVRSHAVAIQAIALTRHRACRAGAYARSLPVIHGPPTPA